ncbi:unnamed protein product [Echinostoma caproni]|uniref:G_PROTEIN_RECEP_F1_2 domain-containing protein n=1 Tax=Echinostoma caproni TaxID=27848 RepID=A0A183ACJ7_9TREM|nr:unnamed protein product [Echinostoma caproni]
MEDNQTLAFAFEFYHHVRYLGDCRLVNDSRIYEPNPALPKPVGELVSAFFALIAFCLNVAALVVFCVDERAARMNTVRESGSGKQNANQLNPASGAEEPSGTLRPAYSRRKISVVGTKRSSATLSLLILCVCECVYVFHNFLFRLFVATFTDAVSPKLDTLAQMESTKRRIQALPVIQNFMFYFADLGLLCRNWAICLITMARAEVVIWPLGAKRWQRVLRDRLSFTIAFVVIVCISMILGYIKHADFMGMLCFHPTRMQFALWMETFLLDERQSIVFSLFCYHMNQTCITWCLIFIFTMLIVSVLKPWSRQMERFLISEPPTPGYSNLKNNPGTGVQASAMRGRQRRQVRATRLVLSIVTLFMLLQFPSFISIAFHYVGYVGLHTEMSRTIEQVGNALNAIYSFGNFFVFIVVLKQFRVMFIELFCCCKSKPSSMVEQVVREYGTSSVDDSQKDIRNAAGNVRKQIQLD